MTPVSIAIWDRRKIIVWISFGLWVNHIAFLIEGISLPLPQRYKDSHVVLIGHSC